MKITNCFTLYTRYLQQYENFVTSPPYNLISILLGLYAGGSSTVTAASAWQLQWQHGRGGGSAAAAAVGSVAARLR